ncbi:hypothetical protein [Actinacidiphila acididurans]|uniref:Uncharacterized protein n=1 Tax=Actinacidiphila acididurans TaxID=2784346 RepID=A0ABS2TU01_9ACTN|nr:hypothetical protein [Actinacidiphila acididurans]MBM9506822.1 hypothetical protein [Actinacidiphila acididurans]
MDDLYVAAAATAGAGEYVTAVVSCLAVGGVLVVGGRRLWRTGRPLLAPDGPVRVGEALYEPSPPRRRHRTMGRAFAAVGWFFLAGGVLNAALAVHAALT